MNYVSATFKEENCNTMILSRSITANVIEKCVLSVNATANMIKVTPGLTRTQVSNARPGDVTEMTEAQT